MGSVWTLYEEMMTDSLEDGRFGRREIWEIASSGILLGAFEEETSARIALRATSLLCSPSSLVAC